MIAILLWKNGNGLLLSELIHFAKKNNALIIDLINLIFIINWISKAKALDSKSDFGVLRNSFGIFIIP
jgi:hypothetical protein